MGKKDKDKGQQLKNPKGTRDWSGTDVKLLRDILTRISRVFEQNSGQELDTPVFELQDVLKGKYGEDSKLIYDVADQGGELLSLRYDLTVPFARWLAMNPNISNYTRFQIGKVYRRDQPAIAKGRMREFYQCDIDFAGPCEGMYYDAKVISLTAKVFEALEWGDRYTIKLNDRRILDGLFEVCGVPADKIRTISSAVDKLDKMPWSDVRKEMVEVKGLDGEVADRIETYVTRKGGLDLLEELKNDEKLMANEKGKKGVEEFEKLMRKLNISGVLDRVSFDLSLARGLDYYTGVIYEVVTEGSAPATVESSKTASGAQEAGKKQKKQLNEDDDRSDDPSVGIGSVAAGGRYDNLVDRFRPGADMPCVGISFGVDRIFSITKARIAQGDKFSYVTSLRPDVWIMSFGSGMLDERWQLEETLSKGGIRAQSTPKEKPKLPAQFKQAELAGAPFAVIVGEDEWKNGQVKIKEMGLPDDHPEKNGVAVDIDKLVEEVQTRLKIER